MKKAISCREALRWMALTTTAFLAACQNIIQLTPTASQVIYPTQSSTRLPESTATSQPEIHQEKKPEGNSMATVYMTTAISADGLMKVYQALNRKVNSKVAVKISSGEPVCGGFAGANRRGEECDSSSDCSCLAAGAKTLDCAHPWLTQAGTAG